MRKELKERAKKVLKKHYWLFVMLCLFAAVLGTEFTTSLTSIKSLVSKETGVTADISTTGTTGINQKFTEILYDFAEGNDEQGKKLAEEATQGYIEKTKENPNAVFGRSRGVLSSIVNGIASGSFLVSLVVGLKNIVGSDGAAVKILIVLSLIIVFMVWVFGINLYQVILRRMVLEGRCYDKVYKQRALFLLKVRQWFRAGITLFTMSIYMFLWALTVVGIIIKRYSYFLVPYIVAEAPELKANEAITLSRKLMKGHKWECFVLELSFIGWNILNAVTLGLSGILYSNPYKVSVFAEYYVHLRNIGKEKNISRIELLNDKYLYERADEQVLVKTYNDIVVELKETDVKSSELTGFRKIFSEFFGLTFRHDEKEKNYEESQARILRLACGKEALEGKVYPTRLSPIPEKDKRKWIANVHYIRNYSIWSVTMIYFIMAFIGWVWEVSLHLISDGEFVNRGVLHGPWLPIYGTGSILILLLLNKFRKKPAVEFLTAVLVCGAVEYYTSYYLELAHNGKKWWDYSGYFLNLNGRICAEGLLTFGVGGMVIVYVLAPVLDNLIRRIPYKVLIATCLILISIFTVDQIYSKKHPNEGKGITDYAKVYIESGGGQYRT